MTCRPGPACSTSSSRSASLSASLRSQGGQQVDMLAESLRCKAPQESLEAQVFPRCGRECRVAVSGVDPDVSVECAHTLSFTLTSVSQLLPVLVCGGFLPEAAVKSSGEGLEITPLFRGQIDEDLKCGTLQGEGQVSCRLLPAPSIVESSQVDLCQVGL